MNDIIHVVGTRFNVKHPDWDPELPPGWMENRIDLFNRYCLPSMRRQLGSDFCWVIFFDRKRSAKYSNFLDKLAEIAWIEIAFVDCATEIDGYLCRNFSKTDHPFLTSRLDNDDIVHPYFLREIQDTAIEYLSKIDTSSTATKNMTLAIDFPQRLILDADRGDMFRNVARITTPFVSFLTAGGGSAKSVFAFSHPEVGNVASKVIKLPGLRTLTVVHGANILNGSQVERVGLISYLKGTFKRKRRWKLLGRRRREIIFRDFCI